MAHSSIIAALALLGTCLYSVDTWAVEWARDGATLTVTYEEPSRQPDGAPLTDLAKTNVYYQIQGQKPVKGPDIQATRPTGGGTVATKITLPILRGQRVDVTFWATATNRSGRESVPSTKIPGYVNRPRGAIR